jgi:hypothetical protein
MREHPSAWGTRDENRFMTRTVFTTIVLFCSHCIKRYEDSKSEKEDNIPQSAERNVELNSFLLGVLFVGGVDR